ncbi:radical SAM protein [Mariniblastus sp.]|nr:radical SAM protein [Mariniblastus sp.]
MTQLPIYSPTSTSPQAVVDEVAIENFGTGEHIKDTTSICPVCLAKIPAKVFDRDGSVYMDKTCSDHGDYSALLASERKHYYVVDPNVESLACCCGPSQHCGDQVENHSCNMLIEITQSCNLTCPTCYAGSSPQNKSFMSVEQFTTMVDGLLEKGKGDADLIQLSGGEPTIHPDFFEILEIALDKGIKQVYINTNAIKLSRREFAERVASYGSRVSVYLQFDGFREKTYGLLRGREDLLETKIRAADLCEELGINTVPTMTLTREINDDEVGELIRWASSRPNSIRKIMIQPAMYSGRYDNPRLIERMTVADVVNDICDQTDGLFNAEDFTPIPCSDPNCFSLGVAIRTSNGLMPISRYLPRYRDWAAPANQQMIAAVADTFDSAGTFADLMSKVVASDALQELDDSALDALLDMIQELPEGATDSHDPLNWNGMFAIGIKPFMDAYSYDQDRIDKCCVHIISAAGEPVSFCEYNAINRATGNL